MSIWEHSRFKIFSQGQHPLAHSVNDFSYANPRLPGISGIGDALDYVISVLYPNFIGTFPNVASLPATANKNDYAIVENDGDGKAAGYVYSDIEQVSHWVKRYDFDWTVDGITSDLLRQTSILYVYKEGRDDNNLVGGIGQTIYGGKSYGSNLTLVANSSNNFDYLDNPESNGGKIIVGNDLLPSVGNYLSIGNRDLPFISIFASYSKIGTLITNFPYGLGGNPVISSDTNKIELYGNIGINTPGPSVALEVSGQAKIKSQLFVDSTTSSLLIASNSSGTTTPLFNGLSPANWNVVEGSDTLLIHAKTSSKPILFGLNYSERMRIAPAGIGIGTASPQAPLHIYTSTITGQNEALRLVDGGTGQGEGPYIRFEAGSKTDQARIGISTNATGLGSSLFFYTSANDTGPADIPRLGISSSGNVGIGSGTSDSVSLLVSKSLTGGVTGTAIQATPTVSVTGTATIFSSTPSVAQNLSAIQHYATSSVTLSSGSVGSIFGFVAADQTIANSLTAGFSGQVQAGSGKYNLYMAGTAQNYLAGTLSVGTTAGSAKLHVQDSVSTVARFQSTQSDLRVELYNSGTTTAPTIGSTGNDIVLRTGAAEGLKIIQSTGAIQFSGPLSNGTNTFSNADLFALRNIKYRDSQKTQLAQSGDSLFYDSTSGTWLASAPDTEIQHGLISGVTTGDAGHTQFVMLSGRAGGQTIQGGTANGQDLTLESTSASTKGQIKLKDNVVPSSTAQFTTSWSGTDIGSSTLKFNNLFISGEAKGLRLENLSAAPGASPLNIGRVFFDTAQSAVFVDTGTTIERVGQKTARVLFSMNGTATSNVVVFSTTFNLGSQFEVISATSGERIFGTILHDPANLARVTFSTNVPVPAGNYYLSVSAV